MPGFDRGAVLDSAMGLFWKRGYEATSMAELLSVTGLSKSSLYAAFGGKHDFFLASYDLYREGQAERLRLILESREAPDGIRYFFEQIIAGDADELQRFGCMSTNQAAELGPHDEAVRRRVAQDHQLLEDAFADHLQKGQKSGSVPSAVCVRSAASALVTAFSGFQLTVRSGLDRGRLQRSLTYLLDPLTIATSEDT